jgi:hypothetical protein
VGVGTGSLIGTKFDERGFFVLWHFQTCLMRNLPAQPFEQVVIAGLSILDSLQHTKEALRVDSIVLKVYIAQVLHRDPSEDCPKIE